MGRRNTTRRGPLPSPEVRTDDATLTRFAGIIRVLPAKLHSLKFLLAQGGGRCPRRARGGGAAWARRPGSSPGWGDRCGLARPGRHVKSVRGVGGLRWPVGSKD